jgi:hypothetical protein
MTGCVLDSWHGCAVKVADGWIALLTVVVRVLLSWSAAGVRTHLPKAGVVILGLFVILFAVPEFSHSQSIVFRTPEHGARLTGPLHNVKISVQPALNKSIKDLWIVVHEPGQTLPYYCYRADFWHAEDSYVVIGVWLGGDETPDHRDYKYNITQYKISVLTNCQELQDAFDEAKRIELKEDFLVRKSIPSGCGEQTSIIVNRVE